MDSISITYMDREQFALCYAYRYVCIQWYVSIADNLPDYADMEDKMRGL